jgi:short-subunit dehydrogenase
VRNLNNRVAIITGASRGLGPFIVRALVDEGMAVVLAARSRPELEAVAQDLRDRGAKATAVVCDVSSAEDRRKLVDATLAQHGRIDVLVNNAGIELTARFDKQDEDEIARVIEVNLTAAMLLTRAVLPSMLSKRSGHIVNVASLAGKVPVPFSSPYAASKSGMVGFTESFRSEFRKRGVSATVVCPGFVSEAGMYAEMEEKVGTKVNWIAGTVTPARVAANVVKGIKRDRPEMLVYRGPARLITAFAESTPGVFEKLFPLFGSNKIFEQVADARDAER